MAYINENLARQSHEGMSMSSYKAGSATSEWKGMCADARDAADRALRRAPERAEEIERLYERYEAKAAAYINESNRIGAMCPSVLVTGAGNFPTRKKRKQLDAYDAFYKKDWGFDKILGKLNLIGTAREPVKSNDPDAIGKLEAKLKKLEELQTEMKAANKALRMKDTEKGDANLKAMGYSDVRIRELREGDFCGRIGFPPYALSNNNAEIRRVKKRIEDLKAAKEGEPAEEREVTICGEPCTVVENTDNMRLQVMFDGKPDAECRTRLKANGFRWAPSQGAWQRQLTDNARHALNRVID